MESVEAISEFASPRQLRRGSKKLARNRETNTPGKPNLRLHVDVMTEEQLEQALGTIKENPTTTKIVENTGNESEIETETNVIENYIPNVIETDNQIQNRRSSRKRSSNPIVRFGNPVTQKYLQEPPFRQSTYGTTDQRRVEEKTAVQGAAERGNQMNSRFNTQQQTNCKL